MIRFLWLIVIGICVLAVLGGQVVSSDMRSKVSARNHDSEQEGAKSETTTQ